MHATGCGQTCFQSDTTNFDPDARWCKTAVLHHRASGSKFGPGIAAAGERQLTHRPGVNSRYVELTIQVSSLAWGQVSKVIVYNQPPLTAKAPLCGLPPKQGGPMDFQGLNI